MFGAFVPLLSLVCRKRGRVLQIPTFASLTIYVSSFSYPGSKCDVYSGSPFSSVRVGDCEFLLSSAVFRLLGSNLVPRLYGLSPGV